MMLPNCQIKTGPLLEFEMLALVIKARVQIKMVNLYVIFIAGTVSVPHTAGKEQLRSLQVWTHNGYDYM